MNPTRLEKLRFPLVKAEDLDERQREVIYGPVNTRIQDKAGNGLGGQVGFQVQHPEMLNAYLPLALHCKIDCTLPGDLRELVILLAARFWSCPYLWSSHENMGREAGLPEHVIRALSLGERPTEMSAAMAGVFQFCEELWNTHEVSDATFDQVKAHLDIKQMLDIIAVFGCYVMISMFVNTNQMPETRPAKWPLAQVLKPFFHAGKQ